MKGYLFVFVAYASRYGHRIMLISTFMARVKVGTNILDENTH
jgi:hypothetical protein